jgi:hypothetical protein
MRNRAVTARFRAHRVKQQRGMMWRDDGMVLLLLWWWCGRSVGNARLREGVWAKNAKPSRCSSVLGAPCETAAGDDAERWWGGVDEVMAVVGSRVGLRKPGLRVLGQKPETELL